MLVTLKSIDSNLRRTANKGLISLLNQQQLEQLALKYFGVYQEAQLISYQCPYSGKVYTDYKNIVLEHIVPIVSKGGTVLFNCIPTSKEVNGSNEKGAKHLIDWWTSSSYWDQEAPTRLEKLLNYMLEAYELVFREYTIEEVENSYQEIEPDETILEEKDNLTLDERTESQLSKQAKNNGIHSYLGFILDCIITLEKNNINTTSIKEKLTNLEDQNIFKDIEKYQLYQNIIKQLIISRLGDNNSSYLSYTLNFDIKKLMDSINLDNQEDIYNELDLRLKNIEQLLSSNNLSIVEYFKSLRDITDIDIIYKNIVEISQEDINTFLINIKIGIDTKIDIFIEMLSDKRYTSYENGKPNKDNIFSLRNKIPFKGYESIVGLNTGQFWRRNFNKIKYRLDVLEKNPSNTEEDKEKYQRVRRAIEEYDFTINLEKRLDCFMDMLSDKRYTSYENGKPNKDNIFSFDNQISFKGYESIVGLNTSHFWRCNFNKIKYRLDVLEKNPSNTEEDKEKYQRVRRAIEEYDFTINLEKRLDCFMDMLSDKRYTSYENGKPNKDNIFSLRNKIPFKGYESINGLNTGRIWNEHLERLIKRLDILEKKPENTEDDKEKYQRVRRAINEYEFLTDLEKRIDCFIDMLSDKRYTSYENSVPNKDNIFSFRNKIPFKGYESIHGFDTSTFWRNNLEKIKKRLDVLEKNPNNTEKDKEKYQRVRRAIEEYEFQCQDTGLILRIDCFIEMLSNKKYTSYEKGKPNKDNIFSPLNKIVFKGYESINGLNTNYFWSKHSNKIKDRLDILEKNPNNTEKDKEKYQRVRRAIKEYEFQCQDTGLILRIDCFIEMLSNKKYTSYEKDKPNKDNIFSFDNQISFKGYESIVGLNTSHFWRNNSTKIIPLVFFNKLYDVTNKVYVDSKKDYSTKEYDTARNAILEYLKVSNINEYINKLEQKQKKTNDVISLINLRNSTKEILEYLTKEEEKLIEENNQLRNEYCNKQSVTEIRRAV